jgi:hypothetical protein
MTLKWILPIIVIIVVLCGITITVSADENSAGTIGLDEKQFLHRPPDLPPEFGVKLVDNLQTSKLIEGSAPKSADVIHLYSGVNFVSTPKPLASGNRTALEVFGDFDINYIYKWDAPNQEWDSVYAGDDIVPLEGLAISSNAEQYVPLEFDPSGIPPTKQLSEQWNLIGFSDIYSATARDTLYCVHEDWAQAIGFDAENQQYETSIINGGSGNYSDLREMYPTKGYLLWMNDPGTLIMLNAPWADDYQFYYTDASTLPAAQTAADEQSDMSYGGMPHTNSSALYAYNRMPDDAVFLFVGHGVVSGYSNEGGGIRFWNGTSYSTIAAQSTGYNPGFPTYYLDSFDNEINDILLAVYAACYSAKSSPDYGNLLSMSYAKGVDNVIGFNNELYLGPEKYWSDRFWYRCRAGSIYGTPQTIPTAATGAATDVFMEFGTWGGVQTLQGNYHSNFGVYDYLIPARYGSI